MFTGKHTVLASGVRTSDGSSEIIDISRYMEGNILVNVTAVSGTYNRLMMYVKISNDSNIFYPMNINSLAMMGIGQYLFPLSNFGTYIKLYYEITGTDASFTFAVNFMGKNKHG